MNTLDLSLDIVSDCHLPWPVTQGVPFAPGQFGEHDVACVVDGRGRRLPTQTQCLATWDKARTQVKWLLVDFQADREAVENGVQIEYGPDVQLSSPRQPISVNEDDSSIAICTGPLECGLEKRRADVFAALKVRRENGEWRSILPDGQAFSAYVTDGEGRAYSSSDGTLSSIEIEDVGPLHTSVCIRGTHGRAGDEGLCPYILRLHFYAGLLDVRVQHTIVFNADLEQTTFRGIGMIVPVDVGSDVRWVIGREDGALVTTEGQGIELRHLSDCTHGIWQDGVLAAHGGKTMGWAAIDGTEGAVGVTVRDMWQEFPKAIVLHRDRIDIQLWPTSAEELKFETPWDEEPLRARHEDELLAKLAENPTAGVNFKGFLGATGLPTTLVEGNEQSIREARAFAQKHLQDRRVSWGDTSTTKPVGLAKTHELWLHFSPERIDPEQAECRAVAVQTPPLASVAPAHVCASGAVGIAHPVDWDRFPNVEAGLNLMFEQLVQSPVMESRLYGMVDYGDLVNGHARAHGEVYRLFRDEPGFKMTDLVGWANNESCDFGLALWLAYARTGLRKHWRIAEAYTEHVEDIDTVHANDRDKGWIGKTRYHNILHWSAGPSASHTVIHGWLLHHFFTGNRRPLDVAREAAQSVLDAREPCGIVSNRHGVLRRELTGPLSNLFAFYFATWEEPFGECARQTFEWYLQARRPDGSLPRDIFTDGPDGSEMRTEGDPNLAAGMEWLTLHYARQLLGDEAVRDTVVGLADWILDDFDTEGILTTMDPSPAYLALAYQMTGDLRYAEAAEAAIALFPSIALPAASMKTLTDSDGVPTPRGKTCFQTVQHITLTMAAAMAITADAQVQRGHREHLGRSVISGSR